MRKCLFVDIEHFFFIFYFFKFFLQNLVIIWLFIVQLFTTILSLKVFHLK